MSTVVKVDRVQDVRAGDLVTLTRGRTVVVGEVRQVWHGSSASSFEVSGMGDALLSVPWDGGDGYWTFHVATREVPDLPTEPGSVIVNATIRGETGHTAILDAYGDWITPRAAGADLFTPRPAGADFYRHAPEHITAWEPGRIVPEGGAS